jgi:hypothetical protein
MAAWKVVGLIAPDVSASARTMNKNDTHFSIW